MMDHLDAGIKPSTRGDDVAHVTSADALRNVAFPEGALRPPLQVQWLLLAFLCLWGQGVFLAVISPITVDLAELQVRGQVRALDLKWCTLPVVLWCNKSSCTVLFIALTMCCRNRVQSQLSICTFPLVSDKGRSAEFARLSRATTDLWRDGRFIFPGKMQFHCGAEPCRYGGK